MDTLDSSYYLAGSWYGNVYIKTDRTFAEREQQDKSKTSYILAQSARGANGSSSASTGADSEQLQREGQQQNKPEVTQIEKGDPISGPDLDHSQRGEDKVMTNMSNAGVEMIQNIDNLYFVSSVHLYCSYLSLLYLPLAVSYLDLALILGPLFQSG